MKFKGLISTLIILLSAGELSAQPHLGLDTVRTQLQVRRPALEPVKSLDVAPVGAIDTLG